MKKKKVILILLAVLLAAAVAAAVFRDVVVMYLAPKSVLTSALQDAMEDLQLRYENSPVSLLAGSLQKDGQYAARMELETQNEILGTLRCDMDVQADTVHNRILADGVVSADQTDLDLRLYLDRDFMSISSGDLLGGNNYGITFDSFREDVRSIPLAPILIGESTLSEWNDSLTSIQSAMNRSYRIPEIPEISTDDLQRAMLAAMLLPSRVQKVEMQYMGIYESCYRVSYSAKGDQVAQVLGYLMDTGDGSNAQLNASFYLYKQELVMAQLDGEAGGNQIRCALEFKMDGATRTFRFSSIAGEAEQSFCIRYRSQRANGYLGESWTLYDNFEAKGEGKELSYRWEPVMGELVIYLKPAVTLNIFQTDKGLNIQTEQFHWLLAEIMGEEPDLEAKAVSCDLIVQKGSSFDTPAYKNIDQWSIEDLLVLLGSVGSLLGLRIQ